MFNSPYYGYGLSLGYGGYGYGGYGGLNWANSLIYVKKNREISEYLDKYFIGYYGRYPYSSGYGYGSGYYPFFSRSGSQETQETQQKS